MDPPVPSSESLGYVAPERLLGDVFDQRADIFSAGVLLWEAVAGRGLFGRMTMDAIVTQLVGNKIFRPAPPADAPWGDALSDVAMQALAIDAADRWSQVGVMGAEIETITEGCLASSEEIAQMLRRRTQGEGDRPEVGAPPVARRIETPTEPPPVIEEPSPIALIVRSRPSMPDLGDGVISWSGPRSARQGSWEDEPSTDDEIGVSEPDEPAVGPRPSTIGWAAVGVGALAAIAAFVLLKREAFADVVAESKPVATQIVLAPKVEDVAAGPVRNEVAPSPAGRPPAAQETGRATPARPSRPARVAPAPAPASRSITPPSGTNAPQPVAPPPPAPPAAPTA